MVRTISISLAVLLASSPSLGQESSRSDSPEVRVLLDFGHNNVDFGTTATRNLMADLEPDGYSSEVLTGEFSYESLSGTDLVIIAVPLAEENALRISADTDVDAEVARRWKKPVLSAYSPKEIDVIHEWVEGGGALLLVVDHFPTPGAVAPLLSRFGIEVSDGFAVDENRLPSLPADGPSLLGTAGELVFDRANRTVANHPVTNGRNVKERIDVVGTFVGGAFRLPPGGQSLLTFGPGTVSLLPDVAWEFSESTPRQPIAGWSQGGLLEVGQGRVAVFGELAIFATERGMAETHPEMQNSQLLRNVIRWLSTPSD